VPRERLRECAFEVANAIAGNPPHATRMIKQLQRASAKLPLAEALVVAAQMQAVAHKTADHIEAVTALLEKRVPKFSEDADI
jgi:enoyl-CoA hydratase/carnithine racemase